MVKTKIACTPRVFEAYMAELGIFATHYAFLKAKDRYGQLPEPLASYFVETPLVVTSDDAGVVANTSRFMSQVVILWYRCRCIATRSRSLQLGSTAAGGPAQSGDRLIGATGVTQISGEDLMRLVGATPRISSTPPPPHGVVVERQGRRALLPEPHEDPAYGTALVISEDMQRHLALFERHGESHVLDMLHAGLAPAKHAIEALEVAYESGPGILLGRCC